MRFEDLVRQHAADLYRYAFWLGRDRQQAEDVVQEALLRGWRAFPRLREPAAAKSWLFSIVRNEHYRLAGRSPQAAEVIDLEDIAAPEETFLEMRDALMALPASYAEPLALQVLGGFSCAEIADLLGTTEGAAMTRLTRARQALRRLLAPPAKRERTGGRS
ncbi:MAG TPA: sigma-70 family RNA polymerase sigma factor [Burkholderiales bacterium]